MGRQTRSEKRSETEMERVSLSSFLSRSLSLFRFTRPMSRRRFGGPTLGATWPPSAKGSLSKG